MFLVFVSCNYYFLVVGFIIIGISSACTFSAQYLKEDWKF